jgi:large subunit ribosomal protein L4
MVELKLYNLLGQETGKIEGEEKIFNVKYSAALIHQVLRGFRAAQRTGSHSTKTKGEVRGGGKKPWKQKGTGRARAGSIRSPLWNGGGVIFGPKPRDYSFSLPKKMKKAAYRAVISSRYAADSIRVVEDLNFDSPKTKEMVKILKAFNFENKKALMVLSDNQRNIKLAGRNIPKLSTLRADNLNIYELLNSEILIIQKEAVKKLEEALA